MTEKTETQVGGAAQAGDRTRNGHSGTGPATDGATRRPRIDRRLVLAAVVGSSIVGLAFAAVLGLRNAAPSLTTAGIIQGNVLVRAPGESDWETLRSLSAPVVVGTGLRTTQTGRLALTLVGGASLRLDAGSQLVIRGPSDFELSTGIVYIDADRAPEQTPFAVHTRYGIVRDTGTQFEVAVVEDELRVRVRDGEVRVAVDASTEALAASTGEQIRISADGAVARDYVMPFDPEWVWVETLAGTPIVDGRPLTQFLDWVTRETGRRIHYDSPLTETSVATALLRGSAENLRPMEALDVILSTTEFDYTLRWDGSIVIAPRQ